MTEFTPEPPSASKNRSSVLYALGMLTAVTQAQREDLISLPDRIVATISPRLVALEATSLGHAGRLARMEERQWLIIGGLTLAYIGGPILLAVIKG